MIQFFRWRNQAMPLYSLHTDPLRAVWRMDESSGELLAKFEHKAACERALDGLGTEARRAERLASRLLVKELLGEEIPIVYRSNGAPCLFDNPLHISISHTKGYAALLVQSEPFAGIDIERRGERVLTIRERFLSAGELGAIDLLHEADHLLVHWCAKEALFKMVGEEGVNFRTQLHVNPFPFALSGTITGSESRSLQGRAFSLGYTVEEEFVWVWSKEGFYLSS
ncbi:holo-(acyl carrier protein) synthase 2 [Bacteroidales bacterium Barb4]|nr:holo-(acyl carrier protein) synthase 2 [Bacteroidales bacterium Barb4]